MTWLRNGVTCTVMVGSYTPVFKSILTSTIWLEKPHVKVVWITLLLMCDRNGIVEGAVPGIANAAVVTVEQCREAMEVLLGPDPDSRTTDFDGRRIEKIDGGWRVLNHSKHREKLGMSATGNAARVARYRSKRRENVTGTDMGVMPVHVCAHVCNDQDQDQEVRIREEKIRETREVRAPKKPRQVKSECPESIEPTEATLAVAASTGRNWRSDLASMRDWALAKGERKVDWQAALRGWMRRASEQAPRGQGGNVGRQVKPPQPNAEDDRDRYVARRLGETDDDLARRTADIRSGKRGLYD